MLRRETNAPPRTVFIVSSAISFGLAFGGPTTPAMIVDWIAPGLSTR